MKIREFTGIAFALIALTAICFADRLPSEVPENQIISIGTIIDVVGFVSDSTSMQWTINSQNMPLTRASYQGGEGVKPQVLNTAELDALRAAEARSGITYTTGISSTNGVYLSTLVVPDHLLDQIAFEGLNGSSWSGLTWRQIVNRLDSNAYAQTSELDQGSIHDGALNPTEEIAIVTYSDSIRTNGGHLMMNKGVDFNSQNQQNGLSNLESVKVLTYESIDGSFLTGEEHWSLDVAGNYEPTANSVRCVFASADNDISPAFCNVVTANSELVNINSAQISTKGSIRAVSASGDVPAGFSYQIAVTPVSGSSAGYAEGTVKTEFGGSIMEARGKSNVPSATNRWSDKTMVSGGIKNFQKTFNYQSGLRV